MSAVEILHRDEDGNQITTRDGELRVKSAKISNGDSTASVMSDVVGNLELMNNQLRHIAILLESIAG